MGDVPPNWVNIGTTNHDTIIVSATDLSTGERWKFFDDHCFNVSGAAHLRR